MNKNYKMTSLFRDGNIWREILVISHLSVYWRNQLLLILCCYYPESTALIYPCREIQVCFSQFSFLNMLGQFSLLYFYFIFHGALNSKAESLIKMLFLERKIRKNGSFWTGFLALTLINILTYYTNQGLFIRIFGFPLFHSHLKAKCIKSPRSDEQPRTTPLPTKIRWSQLKFIPSISQHHSCKKAMET